MPHLPLVDADATAVLQTSQSAPLASGWLSLSGLRTSLAYRIGGRTDLTNGELDLWINEAYLDICTMLDLPFLEGSEQFTMTTGAWLYKINTDITVIVNLSIRDTDSLDPEGESMSKIEMREFRRLPYSPENSCPKVWAPHAEYMVAVHPIPDKNYLVVAEFRMRPGLLVDDADYPRLPREMIEGLLLASTAKAHSGLQEYGFAIQAQNEFIAFMRSRPSYAAKQNEGQVSRMVPVNSDREKRISNRRL